MKPSSSSSPLSLNLRIRNQKAPDAFPRLTVTLRHVGFAKRWAKGRTPGGTTLQAISAEVPGIDLAPGGWRTPPYAAETRVQRAAPSYRLEVKKQIPSSFFRQGNGPHPAVALPTGQLMLQMPTCSWDAGAAAAGDESSPPFTTAAGLVFRLHGGGQRGGGLTESSTDPGGSTAIWVGLEVTFAYHSFEVKTKSLDM